MLEDLLLGVSRSRWVVADVVGLIARIFLDSKIGSIKLSIEDLSCLVDEGLSASRLNVLHKWKLLLNIHVWFSITPDIDVGDRIVFDEVVKRSHWTHARVGHRYWFKSLGTVQP